MGKEFRYLFSIWHYLKGEAKSLLDAVFESRHIHIISHTWTKLRDLLLISFMLHWNCVYYKLSSGTPYQTKILLRSTMKRIHILNFIKQLAPVHLLDLDPKVSRLVSDSPNIHSSDWDTCLCNRPRERTRGKKGRRRSCRIAFKV